MNFGLFDATTTFYNSGLAIATNRWYCVQIGYRSAVDGFYKLWINGVLLVNQAANNAGQHVSDLILGQNVFGGVDFTAWGDCVVAGDTQLTCEVPIGGTILPQCKIAEII